MMRLLLDTHALIWWLTDNPRLSSMARSVIADPDNQVLASAASGYEVASKQRLDRLPGGIAQDLSNALRQAPASRCTRSRSSIPSSQVCSPGPTAILGIGC